MNVHISKNERHCVHTEFPGGSRCHTGFAVFVRVKCIDTRKCIFCSKSNSTQNSCNYNANLDHMYKITISKNINMKIYKKNKSKNSWIKIDG